MAKKVEPGEHFNEPRNRALRTHMSEIAISNDQASSELMEKAAYEISGQQIGNYKRGAYPVPTDFVFAWEKAFGEKLELGNETIDLKVDLKGEHDFNWYRQSIDTLLANNTEAIKQGGTQFIEYKNLTASTIQSLKAEKQELWDLIKRANFPDDGK